MSLKKIKSLAGRFLKCRNIAEFMRKCSNYKNIILKNRKLAQRHKDKDKDLFIGPAGICCAIF